MEGTYGMTVQRLKAKLFAFSASPRQLLAEREKLLLEVSRVARDNRRLLQEAGVIYGNLKVSKSFETAFQMIKSSKTCWGRYVAGADAQRSRTATWSTVGVFMSFYFLLRCMDFLL